MSADPDDEHDVQVRRQVGGRQQAVSQLAQVLTRGAAAPQQVSLAADGGQVPVFSRVPQYRRDGLA